MSWFKYQIIKSTFKRSVFKYRGPTNEKCKYFDVRLIITL